MTKKNVFYLAGVIFCTGILVQSAFSFFRVATTYTPDFSIFYKSAHNLLTAHNMYTDKSLYTAFNYPPITAFLYIPLTIMPYIYAQAVFVVVNICCLILSIYFSLIILQKKISWKIFLLIFSCFLFFFPVRFTIGMGQSNLLAYTIFLGSVILWQKNKIAMSAVLFIFAVIAKPILLFLLVFFFLKQSWKWLLYVAFIGLTIFSISYLFYSDNYIYYVFHVIPTTLTTNGREIYYNQGISGFVARLTTNPLIRTYITFLLSIIVCVLSVVVGKKKSTPVLLSILLTSLTLIDSLSWQHHFVFLILPFLCILFNLRKKIISYKVLGIISFVLVATNIAHPEVLFIFPFNLLLSHVFFGSLLLFTLLLEVGVKK